MVHKDPEVRRNYQKEWQRKYRSTEEGRTRANLLSRESRKRNQERVKADKKRNYDKHRDHFISYYRRNYAKIRKTVLEYYSKGLLSCACCSEDTYSFLTLDHINGGGTKERRVIGASNIFNFLRKNGFPDGYQVLCYNCNCGRQKHDGVCPHKLPNK